MLEKIIECPICGNKNLKEKENKYCWIFWCEKCKSEFSQQKIELKNK